MRIVRYGDLTAYVFGALVVTSNYGQLVDVLVMDADNPEEDKHPHGTNARYRYCKCELCYKAHSDYMKEYRRKRNELR